MHVDALMRRKLIFLQMLMNVKIVTTTVIVLQTLCATILLEALFVYVQLDINWLKAIV